MKASFQIIVLVVFIAAALFGVLVFSGAIPIGKESADLGQGTVVLWGTVRYDAIAEAIQSFNDAHQNFLVKYEEKSATTFDHDLLEALASGKGPDMVLLPDNLVFHYSDRIFTLPYQSYSLSTFRSTFAGASEVFLTGAGILAYPLAIDPLILYYNRAMLDSSTVANPPAYWEDVVKVVPLLTQKDDSGKIIKSGIALGHFANIDHAKDILAALFLQIGNSIIAPTAGGALQSVLGSSTSSDPANVLQFYTDFANPSKSVYSWNRSFPNSRAAFSSEKLALYFGFASELASLVSENPNQNFLIAPIPQIRNANFKSTYAHVLGLSILASSKNLNTAFIAANQMATTDFASRFAMAINVAPARRDLLAARPSDAFSPIFYNSALFARSWLDPSPDDTNNIFRSMVEAVLANNLTPSEAIRDANAKLNLLLNK
jgi:ABC-type glycerol-3-phosphate transport system substrate-binding protein